VNGTLLSTVLGVAFAVVGLIDITRAPRVVSFSSAAAAIMLIFIGIWQLVGIWRSAGRRIAERKSQGKNAPWAILARVGTVLGFLSLLTNTFAYRLPNAWANLQIALGWDGTPRHQLRLLNGGREIELAGGIDFGTADDLQTLVSASTTVRTLVLNSLGGRVAEAQRIRDVIRQHRLSTYVARYCASACTVAFMGGYARYLGPVGKLGFHRYSFPGLTVEEDNETNRVGEQELIRAGVTPSFARKAFSTPSSGMWVPDAALLLSSRIVTEIVDGSAFSALASGVTADELVKSFDEVPSLAALKRIEPVAYSQATQGIASGVEQGKSLREVMTHTRNLVASAIARYRPLAGDDVQVQLAALVADEAQLLALTDPDVCVKMLMGEEGGAVDYTGYLPKDLRDRDSAAVAAAIISGSENPSRVVATEQTASAQLTLLWQQVSQQGLDVSKVGQTLSSSGDKQSVCLAMGAFSRGVSLMPSRQAGALMRYLHKSP
jgi:hypothetical protein